MIKMLSLQFVLDNGILFELHVNGSCFKRERGEVVGNLYVITYFAPLFIIHSEKKKKKA